jgi:1,4-alpha-glucan branching enzyme
MITFEIPGTIWAERINLVGDFNGWDETNLPFSQNREGTWVIKVELEAGRTYRFRYLFDGATWRNEWHADAYLANLHGSQDSVVNT